MAYSTKKEGYQQIQVFNTYKNKCQNEVGTDIYQLNKELQNIEFFFYQEWGITS